MRIGTGGSAARAIMSVVLRVGGDKGIIRNLIICEISEELAKRNQIAGLRRIVQDIREIRERIVVLQIGRRIRTRVSRCGQALRVALPRLPAAMSSRTTLSSLSVPEKLSSVVIGFP